MSSTSLVSFFTPLARFSTRVVRGSSHGLEKTRQRASAALLIAIGYYLGTRIGFAWTPAGQPISTFWPPNAILLAALLLMPLKTWWMVLLAVLPAHILAQLQIGVPL